MKHCSKLDVCPKIRILIDHDWACDAQLSDAILKTCDRCVDKE